MVILLLIVVIVLIIHYGNRAERRIRSLEDYVKALQHSNLDSNTQDSPRSKQDVHTAQRDVAPQVERSSPVYAANDFVEDSKKSVSTKRDATHLFDSPAPSSDQRVTLSPDGVGSSFSRTSHDDVDFERDSVRSMHDSRDGILSKFFLWVREDWPLKIGGLLIIFAVGWFISYATTEGWLTEMMRVVIGYLFGIGAIAYGTIRSEKVPIQGNTFLIIGIAAIFVATLAGVHFPTVDLPAVLALVVMLITVFYVTLVSLKQKKLTLTGSMLFFGGVIPLFFFASLRIEMIFAYLFALTLGALWVVAKTGWRILTVMMLSIVAFYSVGHGFTGSYEPSGVYMTLALVFTALFYGANVSVIVREKSATMIDVLSAVGITMLYLFWVYAYGPEDFRVILLLLGAVLFVTASYGIFHIAKLTTPTVIYGAAAFILIGVATAEIFQGSQLTIAYLLEVTIALALGIYIRQTSLSSTNQVIGLLLFFGPLLMVWRNIMDLFAYISRTGVDHLGGNVSVDLFVVLLAAVCAFVLSALVRRLCVKSGKNDGVVASDARLYSRVFGYIGLGLLVVVIWLGMHVFIARDEVATFASLFIYMISGVAFYVYGVRRADKSFLAVGVILFGLVLGRIGLVEFWDMPITMRIVTFFVVGTLFVVAAYAARSHRIRD
jgi:hypothetical protein